MKTRLTFLILIFFLQNFNYGKVQGQQIVIEIEKITDAAIDAEGNFYISTGEGIIKKYDTSFTELLTFASDDIIPLASISVSFPFRIFGFYQFNQSYLVLERYFKTLYHGGLDPQMIGNGTAATYAFDHGIWIFDESDISLKKINPVLNQLETTIELPFVIPDDVYAINQLEAYQNRIYVNNYMKGIYVFDQFGNYVKTLPALIKSKFTLYRDNLIFLEDKFIKSINIYSNESKKLGEIPDAQGVIKVFLFNTNIFLIMPDSIIRLNSAD